MPFKGPIARGTIRASSVLGLRLLVQAGTLLLVTRLLGPRAYGAFAGLSALAVILGTLSTFGLHLVLLGHMSRDPDHREYMLSRALPTTLACGTLLLAVFLAICKMGLREANVPLRVLFALGIAETLLQPLLGLRTSELLAHGQVARSQLLTVLPLALRLTAAAGIMLLAPADPLMSYGYGYLAASVTALIVATIAIPSPWPKPDQWRWPSMAEWREAAGYAALNMTATSPAELDKTLATELLPLADSGVYAAGQRVIGATTLPVIAMMLSALPRLFREGQERPGRTAHLLRWIFAATTAYSLLLSCTLWVCAPAVAWLFGHRYAGIEHMLHWLTLAIPGMTLRMASGGVLMALGKPWMRVAFEVTGLLALFMASVALTARLGTIGMPLALAFSEWTMALIGVLMIMTLAREIASSAT
ncbi:lipopolysaccharide biosynthesis protein [Dyella sp. A6]|uniref:lipopolysaccharide biosynthesis protein n=1 Tax=Dyella aluminiiresistens TaxID=3069105 RepID=UPI002E75BA1C|nr:oligosaccharide flippase family protein [Dyella sp. A6]